MKKCKLTVGKKTSWSFGLIFLLIQMMNLLARSGLPGIRKTGNRIAMQRSLPLFSSSNLETDFTLAQKRGVGRFRLESARAPAG